MIGSLTDLFRMAGMPSDVTLRRLIATNPDFPIIQRGAKGRPYMIDLDAAADWVRSRHEARALDPVARRAAIESLGLEMLASADRREGDRHG